ncbi:MAG TPA: YicC/YloC family endoribonuclease [Steroidobacteraceae bacterium]|nr:YicC/YloC family endoribonuclease [Steroidobacteraceae bacterium]
MTGFARRERQGPWGTLICELRTVNHRYLEISSRLPEDLRAVDPELRQLIGAALRRGKVDATITFKPTAGNIRELQVDIAIVQAVIERLRAIQIQIGDPEPIKAIDVLRWPGAVKEAEQDSSPILQEALELLGEALTALNEMRAREGERIREMLLQRCAAMQSQVAIVKARLPEISQRLRARVLDRIAQLQVTPAMDRLEQELAILAQRMDVDEELDRLGSHLTEIASALDSNEPAGRRLDFLMQELNREANTLSSKSQDVETTRAAVDMKVIIEQMREQIQNIE